MTRTSLLALALLALTTVGAQAQAPVRFAHDPAISPDGRTVVFSWQGALWSVPTEGGRALRLTEHEGQDGGAAFSPDGSLLAFTSNRSGNFDVFVMASGGGLPTRLTYSSDSDAVNGFTPDGRHILFASRRYGPALAPFRQEFIVPVTGGTARLVQPVGGSVGAFSPDGNRLAFVRGAIGPYRRGYHGAAAEQIWVHDFTTDTYRQVTLTDSPNTWPQWSADGRWLYYVAERGGVRNLWRLPADGTDAKAVQVTHHPDPVSAVSVCRNGKLAVYEAGDRLWALDLPDGQPREIPVTAPQDRREETEFWRTLTSGVTEYAVNPAGKEVAFVVRGDIYVTRYPEGGPTTQLTDTPATEGGLTWTADSKTLWFHSDRAGQFDLYTVTSADPAEPRLRRSRKLDLQRRTQGPVNAFNPQVSPDGKKLTYVRDRGDIIVSDLDLKNERVISKYWATPQVAWSPDSRWLAFARTDEQANSDVFIVSAEGGEPVNVSQHPRDDFNPTWSGDGSKLGFLSARGNNEYDAYFVWLRKADWEKTRADRAEEEDINFDRPKTVRREPSPATPEPGATPAPGGNPPGPATPSAPKTPATPEPPKAQPPASETKAPPEKAEEGEPKADSKKVEIDFDRIHERLVRVMATMGNEYSLAASPDGKAFAFTAEKDGKRDVFVQNWDESTPRQLTAGAGADALEWSSDGRSVRFLREGGRLGTVSAAGGAPVYSSFEASVHRDLTAERAYVFDVSWRLMRDRYYDPKLHGVDWNAIREAYRPRAIDAPTRSDFDSVVNEMLGELKSSHVGFYGPQTGQPGVAAGELGIVWDDQRGPEPGLRVADVVPDSPADKVFSKIEPGERVLAINGEPLTPSTDAWEPLVGQVGKLIAVDVQGRDGKLRTVMIRPTTNAEMLDLRYAAWVRHTRAEAERLSGGKVGYLHLRGMFEPDLAGFERDLFAAAHGRDALIIDVRWNGGGRIADLLLGMLMVKNHAFVQERSAPPGFPINRLFAPAWTGPTVLMANAFSVSNAEILTHAFETLRRGPVVGTPTYGGVIGTTQATLVDGSTLRLPVNGWYRIRDGVDLENHAAQPDLDVPLTPTDEAHGRDPELEAAVKAALGELAKPRQ